MRLKKKNYIHIAVLTAMYLIMVLVITRFRYAYGSDLDWAAQHFAIPDTFRREFYKTGDLFPSFIFDLGAGENIYDLAYYGLYSPVILLSYLFPFIPMYIYIQIVSVLGMCVSIFLFYRWVRRKFNDETAFVLTVMFEFSSGLSMHSHRHVMFVSYMPFLILAFGAVDSYFSGKRKYPLVIYTFLCIMCCYFFGVAAVAAITVYGIYEYLRTTEKVTLKDFLKKGSCFAGRIITAVLMSAILLVPTVYCLFSGRDAGNAGVKLSELLPDVQLDFLCYDSYGMGLTLFSLIAVFYVTFEKKHKHTRFLGITMLCFLLLPFFVYALNGTLYLDAKVLIPFMPLCLLLVGRLLVKIKEDKFFRPSSFSFILSAFFTAIVIAFFMMTAPRKAFVSGFLAVDVVIALIVLALYYFVKKKAVITAGAVAAAVIAGISVNLTDGLSEASKLDKFFSDDMYSLTDEISRDEDVVRTGNLISRDDTPNYIYNDDYHVCTIYSSLHNKKYNTFYFETIHNENEYRNSALTTQSQSFLFQTYMGEKYLISDKKTKPSVNYQKIKQAGELSLYKCESVRPLGYCCSELLNEKAFEDIEYPYSLSALMNNIIVPNGGKDSYEPKGTEKTDGFEIQGVDGITKTDSGYSARLEKTVEFRVKLKTPVSHDKLLLVAFEMDNDLRSEGLEADDAKILIDGIKNNLTDPTWRYYNNNRTFEYVISAHDDEPISELKVKFMKGNYNISDIRFYTMDAVQKTDIDRFVFDKQKTKGDNIEGSIDVTKDGYFMLTVPYSDGFTAYVDGEKTEVECVDTAFIGFPLKEGHHEIKINFTAPYLKEAKLISAGGLLILAVLTVIEQLAKRKKKTKDVD